MQRFFVLGNTFSNLLIGVVGAVPTYHQNFCILRMPDTSGA